MKKKLTSRKFILAIAAFVSGCVLCYGNYGPIGTAAGGFIQTAATVAYILAEASVDASK